MQKPSSHKQAMTGAPIELGEDVNGDAAWLILYGLALHTLRGPCTHEEPFWANVYSQ